VYWQHFSIILTIQRLLIYAPLRAVAETRESVEECPKLGGKAGPSVKVSVGAGAEENVLQVEKRHADDSRVDSRQQATESRQRAGRRQEEVSKVGRTPASENQNVKSWSKQVIL
jgi:hypothetical protein